MCPLCHTQVTRDLHNQPRRMEAREMQQNEREGWKWMFVTTPVRSSTEEGLSPHSHITEAQRLH